MAITLLLVALVGTQGVVGQAESTTHVKSVANRFGNFSIACTIETYGAGGVAGSVKVTRSRRTGEQVLLRQNLLAGGGIALLPKGKGIVVFDYRHDGYRGTESNHRCIATRYEFASSGLVKGPSKTFKGEDYFGERMWKIYGLPFPKDRWGLVYA